MEGEQKTPEELENHVNKVIGNHIRDQRKKLKLSSAEVAFRAQISRAYLGRIERAEVTTSHFILFKIAKVLGLDMNHLYRDAVEDVNHYLRKFLPHN
ncbi:helix-turn-helix domain-containing protein [Alkalihalobacillus sp. BA299]|uniref:helix-turn-helix domain-containing protein n=1 Tax=Alkalihalobacillus sp. BA299 TaxID=2815938 RepID=UPI001ADB741A|nr:helix-turn-helix transcriptional regulator [Alkalihalobacillus sp. BA299]